jgi:hypothetical protein
VDHGPLEGERTAPGTVPVPDTATPHGPREPSQSTHFLVFSVEPRFAKKKGHSIDDGLNTHPRKGELPSRHLFPAARTDVDQPTREVPQPQTQLTPAE